ELAAGALGQRRMRDVLEHRRALVGLVAGRLALGLEIDRGAVERAGDGPRQERAVVAGVVPGEAALVVRFLPEVDHELDRVDRGLAVEHDAVAVGLHFLATPRPKIRIAEGRRVAEGVAERLTDRMSGGLELLAGGPVLLPGLRELAVGIADLGEPRLAVGDERAEDAPRQRHPFLAVVGDGAGFLVVAALR